MDEQILQEQENEQDDDIVLLEDEDGNVVRFEFLELVEYEAHAYAVLLPLDDEEEGAVVIVEVVDLGLPTEHYDAVTDDALNQAVFQAFAEQYADKYHFGE